MKRSLILVTIRLWVFVMILAAITLMLTSISFYESNDNKESDTQPKIEQDIVVMSRMIEPEPAFEIEEDSMADSDANAKTETMYFTEDEVVMVAKLLYRECRGVPSDTEKACVAWTVCNRVDSDEFDSDTIAGIVTERYQFAYYEETPVSDELYDLALDVLTRWNSERNGEVSVGRVLPSEYCFFSGDGLHNYFRDKYKDGAIYDYYMDSPYES